MLRRCLPAFVAVVLLLLPQGSPTLADQRDLSATPRPAKPVVPIAGEYWALIIGIDEYQYVPKLTTAVRDAAAVRDVLVQRYGFKTDHVITLFDAQATRDNIHREFDRLGQLSGKDDSVLVYYAGHGEYDEERGLGWWVPVGGKVDDRAATFLTNASIRDYVRAMRAKHVYLVADSCFSGKLLGRATPMSKGGMTPEWVSRQHAKRSRWALTSGGTEPVEDKGRDGHSWFAYFFLRMLRENDQPYLLPRQIIDELGNLVANNAPQTPQSAPIREADDEGGQFVFRLVSTSAAPLPSPTPRAGEGRPAPRQGEGVGTTPSAALSKAEQELAALQEQEREIEEQEKQAALQRQIEDKKRQIEEKKKKIELAKAYSLPQQSGREITGKDGAPMVLIPAGEFTMGSTDGSGDEQPVHRVSLDDYYMDRYEVTTSRYAKFLQDTGREKPSRWNEASQVSDGERPVIGVDWHDADAYCRHYGKRLPTEAEWEKAARGTDGRTYPWGNEAPTGRLAKYDTDGKASWQGYATLASVESYEAGKSPYGLYHMAGNVWEWVADWYDKTYYQNSPDRNPTGPASGSYRVLRGGSWFNGAVNVRSADRGSFHPSYRNISDGFRCAKTP